MKILDVWLFSFGVKSLGNRFIKTDLVKDFALLPELLDVAGGVDLEAVDLREPEVGAVVQLQAKRNVVRLTG